MGRAKEKMMEDELLKHQNEELKDFFSKLLERKEIEDPLAGIAKQLIGQGYESLSPKQQQIVNKFIDGYKRSHSCDRCVNGNVSSLADYLHLADNPLCPTCEYDEQRFMEDK